MTSCFLHQSSLKAVYSKRKEFASLESKFFPFGVDLFSEGRHKQFCQELSHLKMFEFLLNSQTPYLLILLVLKFEQVHFT